MANVFEVGKTYLWADKNIPPVKVLKRTDLKITVSYTRECSYKNEFSMYIRHPIDGRSEYAIDHVPKKDQDRCTCCADWEA